MEALVVLLIVGIPVFIVSWIIWHIVGAGFTSIRDWWHESTTRRKRDE